MFFKYTNVSYASPGTTIPAQAYMVKYSEAPAFSIVGKKSGAAVFGQYLNSYRFRVDSNQGLKAESDINALYDKAMKLDEDMCPDNISEHPTLLSYYNAALELGYAKNCKASFFKSIDAIKFFTRDYGAIIVELTPTTTTHNAHSFEIASAGESLSEDMTKGFVMYGYDANGVILQNTLTTKCGSLGFNHMSWSTFQSLIVQGSCFTIVD